MANYIYSIKSEYPVKESIAFLTDVVEFDSLSHAPVGTPVRFDTYTYNGTLMPAPQFPIEETTSRESLISELQDKKYEQRRVRHEKYIRSYMLHFDLITHEERSALVDFFLSRKGKYDNFKIQYPTMFDGAETLVRFNADALEIALKSVRRYEISIEVKQAVNGQYTPRWAGARREFGFPYKDSSLSTLKTWVNDTAKGRSESFNLDASQVIPYWSGIYTCRLKEDDVIEQYNDINERLSELKLIETV